MIWLVGVLRLVVVRLRHSYVFCYQSLGGTFLCDILILIFKGPFLAQRQLQQRRLELGKAEVLRTFLFDQ